MTMEFKLPDLGENIESGDVTAILVKEGDVIQADQNVIELETDKASLELPCPHAGRVTKVHVKVGDTVPIGGTILTLEPAEAETKSKAPPEKPAEAAEEEPVEEPGAKRQKPRAAAPDGRRVRPAAPAVEHPEEAAAEEEPAAAPEEAAQEAARPSARQPLPSAAPDRLIPAGPATRRLARELGVDLSRVEGTGPGGRITRDDVIHMVRAMSEAAERPGGAVAPRAEVPGAADRDAHGPIRRAALSKIRKTIAANMARSASTIPHVTNFDQADITELDRIRQGGSVDAQVKLTMLPFVLKACALSLRLHPMVNASLDLEHEEIVYKDYVNLGVAVDTERGLVVPVLRDADRLSIPQIAAATSELVEKARAGKLAIEDMRGGTFTVSNLGAFGGIYSTPIINHPEVAILLVGRAKKQAVVVENDQLAVRLMMPLSLSYDHRLVDGATAARFLNEVISFLQTPGRLLLAG